MKISILVLLSFLSIRVSAQLTLNNTPLLSSPGTYSGTLSIPPNAVLSVTGSGTYTLSGVISNVVAQQTTLQPMTSGTGTDSFGVSVTVTTSSAFSGDYQGWKSISSSPAGEWATKGITANFWLQVQYAVPVIITSAQLRSRLNNLESSTKWRIEGSTDGASWTTLYSRAEVLPGNTITTVTWINTVACSYYRFYGVSANGTNPGLSLFQLSGGTGSSTANLIVQAGDGKIILTGGNTYTGGTTINGGTLKAGHLTSLGTGPVAINSGATLDLRGGSSNIANPLHNNGGTILRDDGLYLNDRWLTSEAGIPYSGSIGLTQNSTLRILPESESRTYTLSGVISDGSAQASLLPMSSPTGTDYFGGSVAVTTSGDLNGDYPGWKSISSFPMGEWATQGITANFWLQVQYAVPVIITSAQLRSRLNNLESPANWRIEGSADGTSWTTLYSSAEVLPGNTITTVTWNNTTACSHYRFYGVSANGTNPGLSLFQLLGVRTTSPTLAVQAGNGQILLTGANTYTGGTTISSGKLKAGHLTALGTGTVAVNSGTTLDLRGGFSAITNTITNNGGTILRDDGLYLNDRWLTSDTGTPYSGNIVLTKNSILTQLGTGTYTLSGVISGGYGITSDTGAGNTLILTGTNTYSGPTTISTGTLQAGNGGTTGTLGTGAIINNAALTVNRSNEVIFSTGISGSGAFIKQGTGKTILPAANTYSGATTVEAGELTVSGSLTSAVTVKSGALLSSGVNGTVTNAVLIETGGVIQGGNAAVGTLTIKGGLTLQDNVGLNVYSSNSSVSKIVTTSSPIISGAMTVNLKTPMTAGTYTLLQAPGSRTTPITAGENNSTLYCVNYSWGNNGLQVTANNNSTIAEAGVSGGGTLTGDTSTGLSVVLSTSQTGVTYTLYSTVNNTTAKAATMAGTGNALTFDNLGTGIYTIKGSKDGCLRLMSGSATVTTDATAIINELAKNYIPEAVKVSLTGEAPKDKEKPYSLGELFPSFRAKVIGECQDSSSFYAGFQLSYDGSDKNTVADWAAQLSISLEKGTPAITTKLTDSLKVDLATQTFETTTFFKDPIRCTDNYEFIINSKTVKGQVPSGAVRLYIRLYKTPYSKPEILPTASTNFTCIKENNTVRVSWLSSLNGVDEYDLEWTFIDHYDNFSSGNMEAFSFQEPVRVTVKEMGYSHQVYYPKGRIYYRIRPAGHKKSNPAQRIEGAWTYNDPIAVDGHDSNRTWQQQTIFAEEGKYKKVMSYYDATGRLRQQSTNLSSEQSTLTAETMYDFEGRKALTVMPTPKNGNSLDYKSNLNSFLAGAGVQNFTSTTRKKYNYDNGRLTNSVLDITAVGGAGRYYSSNNIDSVSSLHRNYIPNAEGYAYIQTEYTRDGTGRISRQGGLGKELKIDGSHAMRYYYGSAAEEELKLLFGDKMGKSAHYKKDVTVDANGQATVTYKDQEGRTIATALAGAPPANVDGLASYPAQGTVMSLDLNEKNSKKNGVSETVHSFINTAPNSEMTIYYSWSARGAQLPAACATCGYELTLELTDPNGNKVNLGDVSGDEDKGPAYRKTMTATSCAANESITTPFTHVVLAEIGDYTLRKTLTPTILSYEQLRESVKILTTTQQYRDTVRKAQPARYENCNNCETCNKDSLINVSISDAAANNCQLIRDILEADFKKNPLEAKNIDEYLNFDSNNKLICKYNYCMNNIGSTEFDTRLAIIKDWPAAIEGNRNTLEKVMNADPYFDSVDFKTKMAAKMSQVGIRNFEYDSNGDNTQDSKRDIIGPIDEVTDPARIDYFIDGYGRSSPTGYHFLYYDLREKLAKKEITEAVYTESINQQRWALFRQYYSEGKREIKIEENANCDSMRAELKKQELLPKSQEEIIDLAKRQNTEADKRINAKMTVLAFKSSCAPDISPADSTAISHLLYNYFKSKPYNVMGVIDKKDFAIDQATQKCENLHLDSVRVLLESKYSKCKLSEFAVQNPYECIRDTTVYVADPDSNPVARSASNLQAMNTRITEEREEDSNLTPGFQTMNMRITEKREEEEKPKEREIEEGQTRAMQEDREKKREEEMEKRMEEEVIERMEEIDKKIKEENERGKIRGAQYNARQTLQSLSDETVLQLNALVDLYNATDGNNWNNTTGLWHPARVGRMPPATRDTDFSGWFGVTMQGGNVSALDLRNNNLVGSLPESLSKCKYIHDLRLNSNHISGTLKVIETMTELFVAYLNNNQFSGGLSYFSGCRNLRYLYAGSNELTGNVDVFNGKIRLIDLYLSKNKLSGELSDLSGCTGLINLDLSLNDFTGNLDRLKLGTNSTLWLLAVYNNKLSGDLSSLSGYTRLTRLYLGNNDFTGNINVVKQMRSLWKLNLHNNKLSGALPDLSVCTKLSMLVLSHNEFSGDLSGLSLCEKLSELLLNNNQFTGSTDVLEKMPLLVDASLSNNLFSGSLPKLSPLSLLTKFSVDSNKFTFANLEAVAGRTFTEWSYSPQAIVDTEQTIKGATTITLTASIDRLTTTDCKYQWFKKTGTLPEISLNNNQFTTNGHTVSYTIQSADKGAEFYYKIKNTNFPDLTLTSHVRKLILLKPYTYCVKYRINPGSPAAKLWDFDVVEQKKKCRAVQDAIAAGYVDRLVNTYIEEKTSQLLLKSDSSCLKNATETLGITYTNKEHHYTLYYYDQAGNLVQTVPPQGVQIPATGATSHTLKTTYRYNAQNQVVSQTTPDAGTASFYYNTKGQLRFSQNAQQAFDSHYSYTKYDAQGRITETGEATQADLAKIEETDYPQANRTDVTYTHYDAPAPRSPLNQKYLRSRVSYTECIEKSDTDPNTTPDTTRTYYSYDPHGSVNALLQKLPGLPPKTTHYRYDLVSGKVNYVFYQYKEPDQFVHRYTYDSDNRIREVFTSADRYVWHKDATYKYYLHGPLATTELGHWRNQALNYTYTLQGWIKGVNTIEPADHMVGKSVMSYQLGYYENDYKPIKATQNDLSLWTRAQENIAHQGMYNGNISWMETDLKLFKKPQAMLYKYDQLNRITKSRSLEFSNGNYVARTGVKKYDENYSYDANGNILTLNRKDDKADVMDDFNYSYYANSNKLQRHKTTGGTYVYDAIGNLINDNNEGLSITWTPSGKVRSISKNDDKIFFRYDAMGNRTSKIVYKDSKNDITTYVRDASGNVMAIYRNDTVKEVPIYGSSRIGEYMGKEREGYQTFNLRKYELSNHLGNVLAVISDKVNLYGSGRKVNNQIVADSVRATVVSASDYYPFGLAMKGREFSSSTYRYGFNGKEKDNSFSTASSYDYGFRIYNPQIARFLSVDPLSGKFPFYTPYQFAGNKPIFAFDLDGLEDIAYIYRMKGNTRSIIQIIDYTKTEAGAGPLGHGTYAQTINAKGDKFSESFTTKDGNSIPSFSEKDVNRKNFTNISTRLNARLIEKTLEHVLKARGHNAKEVEGDVQVLDAPKFAGKFATFRDGTADKYTQGFESARPTEAHQSNTALQSEEIGNSDVLIKFYDGAKSTTDEVPNQVGFVREGRFDHGVEAARSLLDDNVNIGAENAARVKNDIEKK